jgi:hypothetical protein
MSLAMSSKAADVVLEEADKGGVDQNLRVSAVARTNRIIGTQRRATWGGLSVTTHHAIIKGSVEIRPQTLI